MKTLYCDKCNAIINNDTYHIPVTIDGEEYDLCLECGDDVYNAVQKVERKEIHITKDNVKDYLFKPIRCYDHPREMCGSIPDECILIGYDIRDEDNYPIFARRIYDGNKSNYKYAVVK